MSDLELDVLDKYKDNSTIFSKVKFYTSGKVCDEIISLLIDGGAEQLSYFSDYVTHCITGRDPNESDITDAKELYEVPAVAQNWVVQSLKCNQLLPTRGFSSEDRVFSGIVACLSSLTREDAEKCWAMITWHGGTCQLHLDKTCTHLITTRPEGAKYNCAIEHEDSLRIVTPDWVVDSVLTHRINEEALYHPRLLILPKPDRRASVSADSPLGGLSTAQILGFDDDTPTPQATPTAAVEPAAQPAVNPSLLEQLRQRMPWNQPATVAPQTPTAQMMNTTQASQQVPNHLLLPILPALSTPINPNSLLRAGLDKMLNTN